MMTAIMITNGTQFSASDAFLQTASQSVSQSVRRDLDHIYVLLVLSKGNTIHQEIIGVNIPLTGCLTAKRRPKSVGVV